MKQIYKPENKSLLVWITMLILTVLFLFTQTWENVIVKNKNLKYNNEVITIQKN